MKKYRLCVCPVYHKSLDTDGYWDKTYNDSFEYIIYDEDGIEVTGWDGFRTEQAKRVKVDSSGEMMVMTSIMSRILRPQIFNFREEVELKLIEK